jgi:pyrroloquinoline quinone biosynthesis protein D
MVPSFDSRLPLAFSPLHRLQWEEAQQKHVILYPEGMVELNLPAAEILKLCDGARTLDGIVEELERKFETSGLRDDILELVESALENGWIRTVSQG